MDTKYKDDLFRKYVQFHECKLNASDNKQRPINDEYLRVAAAALLCLPKIDPFYRFRLIKFYEMAENSLRSVKSSSLHSLHNAFSMLETVGINLFLYPWKKEFKNIKDLRGKSRNLYIARLGCWKSDGKFSAVDFSILSFTCSYMLIQNCCSISVMNAGGDLREQF